MPIFSLNHNIIDTSGQILAVPQLSVYATSVARTGQNTNYVNDGSTPSPLPGVGGIVPNLQNQNSVGHLSLSGISYGEEVVVPEDQIGFDGLIGYLAMQSTALPSVAALPFAIMFSYSVQGVQGTDVNLFDMCNTARTNYLNVKIPQGSQTIQVTHNGVSTVTPTNTEITEAANTVLITGDGINEIQIFMNGLLLQTGTYVPFVWVPTYGTFGQIWNGIAYSGFSQYNLSNPSVEFGTELTPTQVGQWFGLQSSASDPSYLVKSTGSDSGAGSLEDELVQGTNINLLPVVDAFGNSKLQISAAGTEVEDIHVASQNGETTMQLSQIPLGDTLNLYLNGQHLDETDYSISITGLVTLIGFVLIEDDKLTQTYLV